MVGAHGRGSSVYPLAGKQKGREEVLSIPQFLQTPSSPFEPPTRPHFLEVPAPSSSTKLRTECRTEGPLGSSPDPNYCRPC